MPHHGGYRKLRVYKVTEIIYDMTYYFVHHFLEKGDRTIDQMEQAARSGKQNIVEGSMASVTSRETEIKLTNVAKSSLEELLVDYKDFLRVRNLPEWDAVHPRFQRMRDYVQSCDFAEGYQAMMTRLNSEEFANLCITLINQATYMLRRLMESQQKQFLVEGGIREQMTKARLEYRKSHPTSQTGPTGPTGPTSPTSPTSPTDKKGSVVLLILLFLLPLAAKAQLSLGVRGGYNLTHLSLTSDDIKTNRYGFFVGPALCINLPIVGLGLDAAALYDQREARIGDDPVTDIKQKTVTIPINLRYNFAPDAPLSLFIFAGPQFSFNLNEDKKMLDTMREWRFNKSVMSVNVGAGAAIVRNLQLSLNYNIVCGETATITSLQDVVDGVKEHKAKAHAWQLALSIFF